MTSNPFSDMPDEELLRRAREGDRGAWEAVVLRNQGLLATLAEQRVSNRAPGGIRPSDVAQESALKALRAFQDPAQLKSTTQGGLESLLRRVVKTTFLDMVRKAEAEKRDDGGTLPLDSSEAENVPASQPSPSQATSQRERFLKLLKHLHSLPDDQREAFYLHHFERLSMKGIAERLERSESAVDSLLRRALHDLRARMEGSSAEQTDLDVGAFHSRTEAVLSRYFRLRETGAFLELEALLVEYPDSADELSGLLGWLEELRNTQPPAEE